MRFRILLIPYRHGEPVPEVSYDKEERKAVVKWKDQEDHLQFSADGNRTTMEVKRTNGASEGVAESL